VVLVAGKIDRRDETPQILCEAVWSWDDAVRMGPLAFGSERDRLLSARGNGGRWRNGGPSQDRTQGVWGGGGNGSRPIAVHAPERAAVAVAEPEPEPDAVAVATGAPPPAEEAPAPAEARPLQAVPIATAATVNVAIGEDVPTERLLGAIESVKGALLGRPGPLPVVLSLSVAGATRQVRLPDRVAWDERLGEELRRAAGVPVAVELRPEAGDRPA
jgi:hypothetical protein